MKRIYKSPIMRSVTICTESIIAGSGDNGSVGMDRSRSAETGEEILTKESSGSIWDNEW